ncbi:MAG: nuclease, partial [Selenomonadaceae bacterium]|nr:nuclease [Selenomonadaceae bacterium]
MATDSETVDGVLMDDDNASYDKAAKRFLSMKILLAWILKYLVAEFRDSSIKEIAEKYIEGDPALTIGTVPVDSDLTNAARKAAKKKPGNIKGSRNEDGSATEGMAIFDIMFRAIVPATGEAITLI